VGLVVGVCTKCVEPGALLGSYEREYYNAPKMEVMNEYGYDS